MKNPSYKDVLLYGKHAVELAIKNPKRHIKDIYVTKETAQEMSFPAGITIHPADRKFLENLVGHEAVHQGVVAKCDPLPPTDLKDIIQKCKNMDQAMVIVLDQVSDPHNIGAILRSAVAFHASAVIVPEAGVPNESGTLAKSASGALDLIPFVRVSNLVRALQELKKAEFWCIGMDGYAKDTFGSTKLPAKCALIMGSEGSGMRRLTEENCDMMMKLPMNPAIESLNVSNAAAIAMYEWARTYKG
jgi:23S rRNA (guanosine2251-2'-O)-methyltransferase